MQLSEENLIDGASNLQMTENSHIDHRSVPDVNISVSDGQHASILEQEANVAYSNLDLEYKVTRDRYVGDIDPVTKLRHGHGCYTYTNPYFQY